MNSWIISNEMEERLGCSFSVDIYTGWLLFVLFVCLFLGWKRSLPEMYLAQHSEFQAVSNEKHKKGNCSFWIILTNKIPLKEKSEGCELAEDKHKHTLTTVELKRKKSTWAYT